MNDQTRAEWLSKLQQLLYDLSMLLINSGLCLPSHPGRRFLLRTVAGASLGCDTSIGRRVRLTIRGGVRLGDRTVINQSVLLDRRGGLTVGDDVNISSDVRIWTADHDPASPTFDGRTRPVNIGSRSWVASNAIILPGTSVGEGCIVAAGAVVRGNLEPWSIVAGNPGHVVGLRSRAAQMRLRSYRPFFG